jgi:hypothetical protein
LNWFKRPLNSYGCTGPPQGEGRDTWEIHFRISMVLWRAQRMDSDTGDRPVNVPIWRTWLERSALPKDTACKPQWRRHLLLHKNSLICNMHNAKTIENCRFSLCVISSIVKSGSVAHTVRSESGTRLVRSLWHGFVLSYY